MTRCADNARRIDYTGCSLLSLPRANPMPSIFPCGTAAAAAVNAATNNLASCSPFSRKTAQ
jgi:hypothetical protein